MSKKSKKENPTRVAGLRAFRYRMGVRTKRTSRKRSPSPKPATADIRTLSVGLEHLREGFGSRSEAKVPFRQLHCHDHIEMGVNEKYPVVAMFGGERLVLPPNYLVVFWAARPHGPIETTEGGWAYAIHLPLPWILQWRLPGILMRALFSGKVLLDPPGKRPAADLELVKNWVRLMEQESEETRRIVLLEIEARLRRLAIDLSVHDSTQQPAESLHQSSGALGRFEKMATLLAWHFNEPLLISDIAEAVHMKPASAMRLFHKFSGMTIHEYLLQHRVNNAQRLLSTTNAKIDDVASQSGFGSTARFYAAFQKVVGRSPAAYRREVNIP
jgi:AraC family transcriptional regulator, melibiose operon regulatory protein